MKENTHILYIEDSEIEQYIIGSLCKMMELPVISVADINSALEHLQAHHPSLILIDANLAGTSSWEFLSSNKGLISRLPVIMLTADNLSETTQKAINAGVQEVVYKPISYNTLKNIFKKYNIIP